MRATVEHSKKIGRYDDPPVEIDISRGDSEVVIRIRDQGGGIPPSDLQNVWQYSYTTVPPIDDDDFLTLQSRMGMQHGTGGVLKYFSY